VSSIKRREEEEEEISDYVVPMEYIGGHKAYPKKCGTDLLIYRDRLLIEKPEITIPFASVSNIENQTAEHITKTRVLFTGLIGLFWKKKYLYTVIDFNDGFDNQSVILDLHIDVEEAQQIIYQRIVESRRANRNPTG
jgi:hypothetical protein